jgi:hypothetical protein
LGTFLWRSKESYSPAGARPGQTKLPEIKSIGAQRPLTPPSPQRGEGAKATRPIDNKTHNKRDLQSPNKARIPTVFPKSNPASTKENPTRTEIELNGLLKRFVVRQAKAAKRQQVSRPTANTFSPAPVVAASPLAGVGIGSNAGLLFFHF